MRCIEIYFSPQYELDGVSPDSSIVFKMYSRAATSCFSKEKSN